MATPFNPSQGANVRVQPNVTPASAAILPGTKSLRVVYEPSTTGLWCYFKTYNSGQPFDTVTTKDIIILAGSSLIIKKPIDHDRVQYSILSATFGANFINFQPGEGGVL